MFAVVDEEDDLLALDDFEDEEPVSTATSLDSRSAVVVALLMSRASATDKISTKKVPIFRRWKREGDEALIVIVCARLK